MSLRCFHTFVCNELQHARVIELMMVAEAGIILGRASIEMYFVIRNTLTG